MPGDDFFPVDTSGSPRPAPSTTGSRGRVPPHNIEAEESVLGAMLLSSEAIGIVGEAGLTSSDFYRPAHRLIYDAIRSLYSSASPTDTVTVADELRRNNMLDEIGGQSALHTLQNTTPAISSAGYYAKIVQDAALLRQMIYAAGDIAELAYSEPADVSMALDEAENKVFTIAENRVADTTREIQDIFPSFISVLEERYEKGDSITGIATGFYDLDDLLSGLQPSALYIVGARPAMGKTAFGLGIASHVAKEQAKQEHKKPVLVFSLEMGHFELSQRILSAEAEIDSKKLRTGQLTDEDWKKLNRATRRLEVPLFLDDNPQVTVMEIRAKARRIKARYGDLGLILIDYLQLMGGNTRAENRQLEVSEISRNLKILARELNVPIVALSQLSRSLESRADKRPQLSDLRESGSLEQDADVVMFLYRDEVYNDQSPQMGSAEVIVAKHRSGETGKINLAFRSRYTAFANEARNR